VAYSSRILSRQFLKTLFVCCLCQKEDRRRLNT